jgi:transcription elongation factor Elf1
VQLGGVVHSQQIVYTEFVNSLKFICVQYEHDAVWTILKRKSIVCALTCNRCGLAERFIAREDYANGVLNSCDELRAR